MASRENQPLHVALISLVMVTVLLIVLTYWFYSKSVAATNEATDARAQLTTTQGDLQKALFKVQTLEYMVKGGAKTIAQIEDDFANITGTARDEELDAMIKKFEENMLLFGPADQEYDAARNYGSLPEFLLARIRDLNQQLVGLRRTEAQLTADKEQLKQAEAARTQQFEQQQQKAHEDLAAERATFNEHRAAVDKEKNDLAGLITTKDNEINQLNGEKAELEKELKKRIDDLTRIVDNQKLQLRELTPKTFEVPDATITSVNQREGVVYINVGSADNLRRQQTFSVFERGTSGIMEQKPKGRIEATQILGDHVAMCRILEDDLTDILIPGDLVFTPLWSPGQRTHLAMVGFIDMTGNGLSDRDLLKSLININGGALDDQVTVQTRYLIVGEQRGESPGGEETAAEKAEWNDKIVAAQEIGVDQVSIQKLLTLMGWRADVEVVNKKHGSEGEYMPPGSAPKPEKPAEAAPFRPRTPPRGDSGAF